MSRVSVVIPAYRSAGTICRAIDSVLAQTTPAHEIIVVDDGSPDRQNDVIGNTYGARVMLVRQPNGKTASARNTGIERATGNFIAFLDADDYWEPGKLERQLAVFAQHPGLGTVAGAFFEEEPDGRRRTRGEIARSLKDRVLRVSGPNAFSLATCLWTGSVMVRREVLGSERFVTGLEPAEDRDLWVRLVQRAPVYFCSEPLATAVLTPGSISRTNVEIDCSNMLKVVQRYPHLLGRVRTQEWKSHTHYRWAACDPSPKSAIPHLCRSLILWPLPFVGVEDAVPLGRLKRMAVLMATAVGLRP